MTKNKSKKHHNYYNLKRQKKIFGFIVDSSSKLYEAMTIQDFRRSVPVKQSIGKSYRVGDGIKNCICLDCQTRSVVYELNPPLRENEL